MKASSARHRHQTSSESLAPFVLFLARESPLRLSHTFTFQYCLLDTLWMVVPSSELVGKLFDDPIRKRIRDRHDLGEDVVEGGDILLPFFC